jgi:hypothetical protein
MLAIPLMADAAAAKFAEAEGIVCRLTSLVLVDEAGERREGVPATRKVELAAPRVAAARSQESSFMLLLGGVDDSVLLRRRDAEDHAYAARRHRDEQEKRSCEQASVHRRARGLGAPSRANAVAMLRRPESEPPLALHRVASRIDWDVDPDALRHGDLAALPHDVTAAIAYAAQLPAIVALAVKLAVDPAIVVIGLMARAARGHSRSAGWLADALLKRLSAKDIDAAAAALGL